MHSKSLITLSWILGTAALLLLSCHPQPATAMPGNKTPYKNDNPFINGPSLDKGDEVHRWAESMQKHPDGKQRHFRLPVHVERAPDVMSANRYFAGVEKGSAGKDILEIRLDDGRLGIPLSDRVAQYCPDPEKPCIIQIEATWGPLMESVSAMRDDRPVLALNTVSAFTGDHTQGNAAFFISAEK